MKAADLVTRDSVLAALARHIGRDRGTTGRLLVIEICGAWSPAADRALRHCVEQLRAQGYAVCADPSAGYHIAASDADLQQSIAFLVARIRTTALQVRQLQRLARPELRGQRRLPLP